MAELEPRPAESTSEQIASYLLRQLSRANNPTSTASDTELLIQQWHGRPLLFLLDNWEHLLEGATLLSRPTGRPARPAHRHHFREPLNLQGNGSTPARADPAHAPPRPKTSARAGGATLWASGAAGSASVSVG
ncbi:MAG: hypothetical protein IPL28_22470 [Chloroflexi bacterium]|nr:hypothetical protein [Chloroflexota bacterium]